MRCTVAILLGLTLLAGTGLPQAGKDKEVKRFGILLDTGRFPQEKPEQALSSVVKAIQLKQIDYLLAHLADPKFVDHKVDELKKQFGGGKEEARAYLAFQKLVKITAEHFDEDPGKVKDLQRFAKDATWQDNGKLAVGTLKNLPSRKVFLRKIDGRWMLEDREK